MRDRKKLKLCIICGTRPEIIKMASIIRECQNRRINFFILHTGQHYSYILDKIFFKNLDLPSPKYNLSIGSGSHGVSTGKMLIGIEKILLEEKPHIILIEGDTNSVLAGALSASKLHIKIGHVEAGLRSYDRTMPEEINRIITDHISDYLFTPTKKEKKILLDEGIPVDKIIITGNTIVDAVFQNLKIAKRIFNLYKKFKIKKQKYLLLTLHREENTTNFKRLKNILDGIKLIYHYSKFPIIFPIHPRTKKKLKEFHLDLPFGIQQIEPLGFLEFLILEKNSRCNLTDSGGVQEESCILKVPCLTLRDNTERPETVDVGGNIITGTAPKNILNNYIKITSKKIKWYNPFGKGNSAKKIVNYLVNINK